MISPEWSDSINRGSEVETIKEMHRIVGRPIIHPKFYRQEGIRNNLRNGILGDDADLAIFMLDSDVGGVTKAVLNNRPLKQGMLVWIGGYGLQSDGDPTADCGDMPCMLSMGPQRISGISDQQFYTIRSDEYKGYTNHGDSGGGVYFIAGRQQFVVGVNSTVNGLNQKPSKDGAQIEVEKKSHFVRVDAFLPWIQSTIQNLQRSSP